MAKIRERFNNLNPLVRGIAYLVGGLLLLLIILQILLTFFADDYVANTLKNRFQASSGSAYTLDFDDLDLNGFSGSASIQNVQINADTSAFSDSLSSSSPATLFQGIVGEVEVNGLNIFSALTGNELHIGSITLRNPDISALKNPYSTSQDSSKSTFISADSSIYAAIPKQYTAFELDEFIIENGNGLFTQSEDTISSLKKVNLSLRNIRVDSASVQSKRTFVTNDISIDAHHFEYHLPDSLNIIAFERLTLSSENQSIEVDSLELIPKYSKLAFARKHGSRIDRIDLKVPQLQFNDVDYVQFVNKGHIYAKQGTIKNLSLKDYLNRAIPGGTPRPKPLPFSAFRNLEQQIKIDSLQIQNAFISYSEYVGNTPRAGTVTFEDINATFRNISNDPNDIKKGITTTLDTQSKVMGTGVLEAYFEFPMDTEIGFHKINGTLSGMNITDFNPMLKYVAFVQIEQGNLNKLEFKMRLNENESTGTLIMNYENATFSVLDKESAQHKGLLTNLKTFVANKLVIRKNNTPETGMQPGQIKFQRIKHKSIFNYWWKSLLSGIKNSAKK